MVCVERVVGDPFYSLRGWFPPSLRMETCQTAIERMSSRQNSAGKPSIGGRPTPLGATGHRPLLVHCSMGPDVRWLVPGLGWSVWSGLWALFACVTQDTIICGFCLRIRRVFLLFRTCAPEITNLRK